MASAGAAAPIPKKKMVVDRMSQREQQAALPAESLRVLLEVLAFRGYMPEEVVGVHPDALVQMQAYLRECRVGAQVPVLSDLPVTSAALTPFMAVTPLNIRPVITARVREDAPPWCAARAAGDPVGAVTWVLMARPGGQFTYIPVKPGSEAKAASGSGKRAPRRPKPRTQVAEQFSIDVVRRLLSSLQGKVHRVIIVTVGKLSTKARETLLLRSGSMVCEMFTFQETQGNALRHCLTPHHEIMRPYYAELRHVQSLRERGEVWRPPPRSARRPPGWRSPGAEENKGEEGPSNNSSPPPITGGRALATPATRGDPLTLVQTGMSDMVVRLLALPQHTILRVHEHGVGAAVEPSLTVVRYVAGESIRSTVGGMQPIRLPEFVSDSEAEEEEEEGG